jgi:hypothetical protein
MKTQKLKLGMWFWTGSGIYSLINMIKNYYQVAQSKILLYDTIIFSVAIIGFILTLTLLKKMKYSKTGIGFWVGSGVFSLINMFMNYKHGVQSEILFYNYLMFGVAISGFILNLTLLKINKRNQK